ncbi:MAG: MFS transporter [Chloroflexota bacterium]
MTVPPLGLGARFQTLIYKVVHSLDDWLKMTSSLIMNNRYFALLANHKDYRYLWLAAVVSFLGDWFNTIASVIIVSRYTDAGLAVGGIFLARALPPFLLGPVAGVYADRFNRKHVMIFTDIARAIIVLGFLLVNSADRVWLIYVLTALQFAISSLFQPAQSALLPTLVETDEELLLANTLSGATWSAMLAIGAAIGGFTAALFGVEVALIADAATFLLSAFLIAQIATEASISGKRSDLSGYRDFVEGMRYIINRPAVGLIACVKGLFQIGSIDVMTAIYANQLFPVGAEGATSLGLMFMASGVGAIIGPLIANRFNDNTLLSLQRWIGIGFGAVVVGWLILGWAPSLPVVLIGLAMRLVGGAICWTYSNVILQLKVPNQLLGRVTATDFAIYTLVTSISVWLTGYLLDTAQLEPRLLSTIFGVCSITAIVIWVFAQPMLNRDADTST